MFMLLSVMRENMSYRANDSYTTKTKNAHGRQQSHVIYDHVAIVHDYTALWSFIWICWHHTPGPARPGRCSTRVMWQ